MRTYPGMVAAVCAVLVAVALSLTQACSRPSAVDPAERPAQQLDVTALLGGEGDVDGFARVTEPRRFEFPDDHGIHPQYRLEWWYLTGSLSDAHGRRFGFQFTLFRFALAPEDRHAAKAGWASRQVYMAHVALTHVEAAEHRFAERLSRAGPGLAGVRTEPFDAWLYDWRLASVGDGFLPMSLTARATDFALLLEFAQGRPKVLHGDAGYSRKGRDPGNASHYYSFTRLPVSGQLLWDEQAIEVRGTAWMDREWGSSVLDPDVVGWDWLALRLDDGRDLMLFRLRQVDGSSSPFSAGTLVNPDGSVRRIADYEFEMLPFRDWKSPWTGSRYPVAWHVRLPAAGLDFVVEAVIPNQEMRTSVRYWEGLVQAVEHTGLPLGEGFLELTGY